MKQLQRTELGSLVCNGKHNQPQNSSERFASLSTICGSRGREACRIDGAGPSHAAAPRVPRGDGGQGWQRLLRAPRPGPGLHPTEGSGGPASPTGSRDPHTPGPAACAPTDWLGRKLFRCKVPALRLAGVTGPIWDRLPAAVKHALQGCCPGVPPCGN